MHYLYFLIDPTKGLLNYLFSITHIVFYFVILILCISHWPILKYWGTVLWGLRKKRTIGGKQIWHITTTTLHLHLAKYKTMFSEHERSVFAHKIGYILRGLLLICFWRTIVSYLFRSFASTGWLNRAELTNSLFADIDLSVSDQSITDSRIVSEKTAVEKVFGPEAWISTQNDLQKLDVILNYTAVYELLLLTIAGYFFLISLWNSFLKNTGWFFVVVTILLHLTATLLAMYEHIWSWPYA